MLASQFDTVWIPPAVLEELRIDEALPGVNAIQKSLQSGWLKTREEDAGFYITQQLRAQILR